MIYSIVLFACSAQGCNPHIIASGLTLSQCEGIGAQSTVAQFMAEHPDLTKPRWVCTPNPRQVIKEKQA